MTLGGVWGHGLCRCPARWGGRWAEGTGEGGCTDPKLCRPLGYIPVPCTSTGQGDVCSHMQCPWLWGPPHLCPFCQ